MSDAIQVVRDERPLPDQVMGLVWEIVRRYIRPTCSPADAKRIAAGQQPEGPTGFAYIAAWHKEFGALLESLDTLPTAAAVQQLTRLGRQDHARLIMEGKEGDIRFTPAQMAARYREELGLHQDMRHVAAYVSQLQNPHPGVIGSIVTDLDALLGERINTDRYSADMIARLQREVRHDIDGLQAAITSLVRAEHGDEVMRTI